MKTAWYDTQSKGRVYVLLEPYKFTFGGNDFVVPAGFESDGMSVPRWLWWMWSPLKHPDLLEPSVVHDWLYSSKVVSRRQADIWYKNELESRGYSVGSLVVFGALRAFGWSHW